MGHGAGIGQGYMLVTPMQLAYAASIIANRGFAFRYILNINLKNSDEVLKLNQKRINHVIDIDDKCGI